MMAITSRAFSLKHAHDIHSDIHDTDGHNYYWGEPERASLVPSPSLASCEIKAGVGRTGNEARSEPQS